MDGKAGLFLDLDGTLADSLSVMRAVYARFLAGFGKQGCDGEFADLNGPPLRQVVETLAATHRLPLPVTELLSRYRALIDAAYEDVAATPAAGDVLETAKRLGIATGVVTSNATGLTQAWLHRVGLAGMVDVIVGGDAVRDGKPNPLPYRLALHRTGCTASVSFAVEDSCSGANAAVAAGLQTFLLTPPSGPVPAGIMPVRHLRDVADHIIDGHIASRPCP